eukprot:scaffold2194_cov130-Cylindrotheca_fusiformis.AAC.11
MTEGTRKRKRIIEFLSKNYNPSSHCETSSPGFKVECVLENENMVSTTPPIGTGRKKARQQLDRNGIRRHEQLGSIVEEKLELVYKGAYQGLDNTCETIDQLFYCPNQEITMIALLQLSPLQSERLYHISGLIGLSSLLKYCFGRHWDVRGNRHLGFQLTPLT